MSGNSCAEGKMRQFWEKLSSEGATVAQMVQCSDAEAVSKLEVPEVLALLPEITGKDVLELGAGIGRFTEHLVKKAKSVTCVDFVPTFTDVNRHKHGSSGNVTFLTSDVTKLSQPPNSCDLIFGNRLMMYLTDTEALELFTKALTWLRPGGYLFFCETCFRSLGDATTPIEGVFYRRPDAYNSFSQSVLAPVPGDKNSIFAYETVYSKSIQAYVKLKSSCNEICWLLQKRQMPASERHGFKTFQEFLDNKQYSRNGILRYERVFGMDFVSTGGLETTKEFVEMLNLKPGEHVLDVGAGIGGSGFYMAKKHGVFVTAIDLSANMISIGLEKANNYNDPRVQFEVCDATKCNYAPETFDVIYSRDTILHIDDKRALFTDFLKWLKPGGRLLISDYCCTAGKWSEIYQKYVAQRGYQLLDVVTYGKLLEEVGFIKVKAEDRTEQFVRMLQKELKRMEEIRDDFIKEFTETDYNELVEGWTSKVKRCGMGDQKWGLFYAEKS